MYRDFFELKKELQDAHQTFTSETLKLLAYSDLLRAAIGDAGVTACDLELVDTERKARLEDAAFSESTNLQDIQLLEDILLLKQCKKFPNFPKWDSLSPLAQAYFLIRCLRAHVDNPQPRLRALLDLLKASQVCEGPSPSMYFLLEGVTTGLLATEALSIQQVRRAFRGFDVITKFLPSHEQAICLNLCLADYSCTGGCFHPTTFEGHA